IWTVLGSFLLSTAFARTDEAKQASWPQFRGPNRDDVSTETGLLKQWPKGGPPLAWKAPELGRGGHSSVSLADGKIFTMGDKDGSAFIHALDAKDGKLLWSAKVGKAGGGAGGSSSTPTVSGDLVCALGQHGDLVCVEKSNGKERWRHNLADEFKGTRGGWDYCESVLLDGDWVICTPGGAEATLLALDKKTGAVVWKCPIPNESAGYSSIVVSEAGGVRQYVQLLANSLVGVRAKDGKLLWRYGEKGDRFGHNTANIPTPIVLGNQVFAAAGYGRGGALLELSGSDGGVAAREVYFNRELNNKHGGVVVVGENVFADRDDSGTPYCADLKTGKVKWHKNVRSDGSSSAAITYADDRLYVRYANGYVALVEANAGGYKEHGSFKIPNGDHESWSHPVVVGGRLYLREKDVLWCYDVKEH
ncbi:MAG TPA: PQQ-binding-like beta-propeller repeat protein, partial [Gemmataceae bacterium]|nr:PQQ-binding-like beta-propeller repeat protein [Gemmataceae bacterium]